MVLETLPYDGSCEGVYRVAGELVENSCVGRFQSLYLLAHQAVALDSIPVGEESCAQEHSIDSKGFVATARCADQRITIAAEFTADGIVGTRTVELADGCSYTYEFAGTKEGE